MKKLLALILAVVFCLGMVACGEKKEEEKGNNIDQAVSYLNNLYKDAAASTPADYDLVGKLIIGEDNFTVTWTVDNEAIKVIPSEKADFWTVDVPDVNEAEVTYKITATVKAADGETKTKSFDKVLPVIELSTVISEPVEGEAYKLFIEQNSVGKTIYAINEISGGRYIKSITDAKAAPDFFVEKVEGGYKFYIVVDGAKLYVTISLNDAGKECLSYTDNGTVWYFKEDVKAWMTQFNGGEYYMGTYSTYDTISVSASSYIKPDNTGVSQFPVGLVTKEAAESNVPETNEPEVLATPEEIVNGAYELEENAVLSQGYNYTLSGVVIAVNTPYSEQYGNVTVTIVVEGMSDKPIECFRMKGEGAEKVAVGDNITVTGVIKNYNGKVEFDASCSLDSLKTPTEVLDVLYALEAGGATTEKYTLTGVIVSVDTVYSEQYGNVTVTIKVGDDERTVQCFRLKGENAATIAVGDTITVCGTFTNYNGTYEFNSGCVIVPAPAAE